MNQNRDAVVRLQSGYSMVTAAGNLIPVASGQSDGRELQGNMNRVGKQFSHFISVSISGDKDLDLIKAYQDKLGEVPGIGKKKNPKKMHITLGCINITEDEVEETEMKFKKIGEKFTDVTRPGPFLLNLRCLEMGDESEVLFVKVQ